MHFLSRLATAFFNYPWAPVAIVAIVIMLFALVREIVEEERAKKHPNQAAPSVGSIKTSFWRAGFVSLLLLAATAIVVAILPRENKSQSSAESKPEVGVPPAIVPIPAPRKPVIPVNPQPPRKFISPQSKPKTSSPVPQKQPAPSAPVGETPQSKPSSPTPQQQTCVGSNCVQGPNFGPQILNQYGAPKLVMTDVQKDAIRDAMKSYAGSKFTIMRHDATPDSSEYADRLRDALKDAGMICTGDGSGIVFMSGGGVPPGVWLTIGKDEKDAANTLGKTMLSVGLIHAPLPASMNDKRSDAFDITVAPNR